jgi:exonuclease III
METIKISMLNINGLTSHTRVGMLEGFLRQQNIDVLFLQEASSPDLEAMRGCTTHHNVGTSMRGTTIVTRDK